MERLLAAVSERQWRTGPIGPATCDFPDDTLATPSARADPGRGVRLRSVKSSKNGAVDRSGARERTEANRAPTTQGTPGNPQAPLPGAPPAAAKVPGCDSRNSSNRSMRHQGAHDEAPSAERALDTSNPRTHRARPTTPLRCPSAPSSARAGDEGVAAGGGEKDVTQPDTLEEATEKLPLETTEKSEELGKTRGDRPPTHPNPGDTENDLADDADHLDEDAARDATQLGTNGATGDRREAARKRPLEQPSPERRAAQAASMEPGHAPDGAPMPEQQSTGHAETLATLVRGLPADSAALLTAIWDGTVSVATTAKPSDPARRPPRSPWRNAVRPGAGKDAATKAALWASNVVQCACGRCGGLVRRQAMIRAAAKTGRDEIELDAGCYRCGGHARPQRLVKRQLEAAQAVLSGHAAMAVRPTRLSELTPRTQLPLSGPDTARAVLHALRECRRLRDIDEPGSREPRHGATRRGV